MFFHITRNRRDSLYYKIFRPLVNSLFSFTMNVLYWMVHINRLPKAKRRKATMEKEKDISNILMKFTWKDDSFPRWRPWIITILSHFELKDKCRGAAYLGQWLLEKENKPSKIYVLKSKDKKKTKLVCVSKNKKHMIVDNLLYSFQTPKIKREIYTFFNEVYDTINGIPLVEKRNGIIVP